MATTTDTIIAEARYDLRDVNSTLYTDTELFYYANRGLRQLDNVLSALNSDQIYNESDVDLSTGNDYASSPSSCIAIRSAWISQTELVKIPAEQIYEKRKYISSDGQPYYFAEVGTQMLFEMEADDDYTIKTYYDKRATALSTGNNMPYNDEFNDAIREIIVTLAHKRNEVNVFPDTEIYNFFMDRLMGNMIRRSHEPLRFRLDF